MNYEKVCPECGGFGQLYDEVTGDDDCCKRCDGYGTIEQSIGNEKLTREELNENNK